MTGLTGDRRKKWVKREKFWSLRHTFMLCVYILLTLTLNEERKKKKKIVSDTLKWGMLSRFSR